MYRRRQQMGMLFEERKDIARRKGQVLVSCAIGGAEYGLIGLSNTNSRNTAIQEIFGRNQALTGVAWKSRPGAHPSVGTVLARSGPRRAPMVIARFEEVF